jgi:hypothetical protein
MGNTLITTNTEEASLNKTDPAITKPAEPFMATDSEDVPESIELTGTEGITDSPTELVNLIISEQEENT